MRCSLRVRKRKLKFKKKEPSICVLSFFNWVYLKVIRFYMGGAGVSKHSSARSSIKVLHCAYSQFLNSDESHHRLSKSIQKAQFKIKNFSQHAHEVCAENHDQITLCYRLLNIFNFLRHTITVRILLIQYSLKPKMLLIKLPYSRKSRCCKNPLTNFSR